MAADYPDTTFALIDSTVVGERRMSWRSASRSSRARSSSAPRRPSRPRRGKVGYIGANSQPFIEAFRAGFEQGAVAADPDVEIVVELIDRPPIPGLDGSGGYIDPERAHRDRNCHVRRRCGRHLRRCRPFRSGVIEAATELSRPDRKLWAIGVDTDQYFDITDEQRTHLLTSMFKRFDSRHRSGCRRP